MQPERQPEVENSRGRRAFNWGDHVSLRERGHLSCGLEEWEEERTFWKERKQGIKNWYGKEHRYAWNEEDSVVKPETQAASTPGGASWTVEFILRMMEKNRKVVSKEATWSVFSFKMITVVASVEVGGSVRRLFYTLKSIHGKNMKKR